MSTKVTQKVAEVAACAQADRLNALMNYTQQSAADGQHGTMDKLEDLLKEMRDAAG